MLFAVAVVAITGATIGPMFLQSADSSILSSAFSNAAFGKTNLTVISNGGQRQFHELTAGAEAAVRLEHSLLAPPLFTIDAGSTFTLRGGQSYQADILARSGVCTRLRIASGSCPRGIRQVAISKRSALAAHLGIGSPIRLGSADSSHAITVSVVGIYLPPPTVEDSYWQGNNYFSYGYGSASLIDLDPLISSFATAARMGPLGTPQLVASIGWRPVAPFRGQQAILSAASRAESLLSSGYSLVASTQLSSVIAAADHEEHLTSSIVLVIVLQLVLLALLILYTLGRSASISRRPDSEFARRHGFTRASLLALALGEPATLIVAALPAGILIAWATLEQPVHASGGFSLGHSPPTSSGSGRREPPGDGRT